MSNFDDLLNHAPAAGRSGRLSKEEYAEKKQAEREDLFELSDNTAIKVGCDSAEFRQYLDVQARFDRYSAVNALLILAQQKKLPEQNAERLGDFGYWKEKGGFVKTGQTGISILEPQPYTKEDGTPGMGYNIKKVFDISQVDTRKIKTTPAQAYNERQLLGALISKAPVKITGVSELPDNLGAVTDPETGEISVRKGMEFADTFRSVARELAFADLSGGPDTQADTQFSAYCASYMLCKKHGVDTRNFDFSDAPGVFEGMDAGDVKGELSQIRDVADNISGRMARQFDTPEKTSRNREAR